MKVLFNHSSPFALAHGGFQIQIEQTKEALEKLGIEVEYVRWWDEGQKGELIHHFSAPPVGFLKLAREKGIPSVVTHLFSSACNRSPLQLKLQAIGTQFLLKFPGQIRNQLNMASFRSADKMIVGLEAERRVLERVFGLPPARIAKVPLGLHSDFLEAGASSRSESFLITTGTIADVKRSVDLARMARQAQVPLLFVGKPYHSGGPYWKAFAQLVDDRFVRYCPHVSDRAEMIQLLKSSRGFVLYSRYENWSLSTHEAVACGLPLLIQDQPWSRECFGSQASYLDAKDDPGNVARLRSFYDKCPEMTSPAIKLFSWDEVAEKLKNCYLDLISG